MVFSKMKAIEEYYLSIIMYQEVCCMNKTMKYSFAIVALLSWIFNFFISLNPDEVYYWTWSRKLDFSYFDHPPLTAYINRVFTSIFGNYKMVIKTEAVLFTILLAIVIYQLAKTMYDQKIADMSLILFLCLPFTHIGFMNFTIDLPFVLFWTVTIYLFYKYIKTNSKKYIYLAGLTAGLMMLSKYTGILLFPALFLFLITSKYRRLLLKKDIYLSFLISVLLFSPVIWWNYQYDWISFKFQFFHGVSVEKMFHLDYLVEFILGQLGMANPLIFIALIYYLLKNIKQVRYQEELKLLFFSFIVPLVFFGYNYSFKKGLASWTAPAYMTAIIILAYFIVKNKNKIIIRSAIALIIIVLLLLKFPAVSNTLLNDYLGYKEVSQRVNEVITDTNAILLSDKYENAAEFSFYLNGKPDVYTIGGFSQFSIWGKEVEYELKEGKITSAYYIGQQNNVKILEKYFKEIKLLETINYSNRLVQKKYYLYACEN